MIPTSGWFLCHTMFRLFLNRYLLIPAHRRLSVTDVKHFATWRAPVLSPVMFLPLLPPSSSPRHESFQHKSRPGPCSLWMSSLSSCRCLCRGPGFLSGPRWPRAGFNLLSLPIFIHRGQVARPHNNTQPLSLRKGSISGLRGRLRFLGQNRFVRMASVSRSASGKGDNILPQMHEKVQSSCFRWFVNSDVFDRSCCWIVWKENYIE